MRYINDFIITKENIPFLEHEKINSSHEIGEKICEVIGFTEVNEEDFNNKKFHIEVVAFSKNDWDKFKDELKITRTLKTFETS